MLESIRKLLHRGHTLSEDEVRERVIAAIYGKDYASLDKVLSPSSANALDEDGRTPLMHAVLADWRPVTRWRGTIRDHATHQRRPLVRFFACEQDLSGAPADAPLPDSVARGAEPLFIVRAIAGG
jgi:hypothetical protein